ncbi:MAG: hypothetical protein RLZZ141_899 [Pseudomonadota bacterium]|jgi:hypothetical protein
MTVDLETAALAAQARYWVAYEALNTAAANHDEEKLKLAADGLDDATHKVFITLAPSPALLAGKVKIAMQDIDNRAAKEWLETIRVDLEFMSQKT